MKVKCFENCEGKLVRLLLLVLYLVDFCLVLAAIPLHGSFAARTLMSDVKKFERNRSNFAITMMR